MASQCTRVSVHILNPLDPGHFIVHFHGNLKLLISLLFQLYLKTKVFLKEHPYRSRDAETRTGSEILHFLSVVKPAWRKLDLSMLQRHESRTAQGLILYVVNHTTG